MLFFSNFFTLIFLVCLCGPCFSDSNTKDYRSSPEYKSDKAQIVGKTIGSIFVKGQEIPCRVKKHSEMVSACKNQRDFNCCFKAAMIMQEKEGDIGLDKSRFLFKKACFEGNIAKSCLNFILLRKDKFEQFGVDQLKFGEHACNLGQKEGCFVAAAGAQATKKMKKAFELIKKSCELKHSLACLVVAKTFKVRKDMVEYRKHLKMSCNFGSTVACNSLRESLSK